MTKTLKFLLKFVSILANWLDTLPGMILLIFLMLWMAINSVYSLSYLFEWVELFCATIFISSVIFNLYRLFKEHKIEVIKVENE